MSGEISNMFVSIGANTKKLNTALDEADKGMSDFAKKTESRLGDTGKKGGSMFASMLKANIATKLLELGVQAGGALINGFTSSITAASDLNETISKTNALLGEGAKAAQEFAKIQEQKGIATQKDTLDSVTSTVTMLQNQGVALKDAVALASELEGRMGDISSQRNIDPKELRERIQSGLSGELQTLRGGGLNISLTADQMKSKYGAESSAGAGDGVATGVATIKAILEQTESAAGDLEKTQYSIANMARANEVKQSAALASMGQIFQTAGTTFEVLKSSFLDVILNAFSGDKFSGAIQSLESALFDLIQIVQDIGPPLVEGIISVVAPIVTGLAEAFKIVTESIRILFVAPLQTLKVAMISVAKTLVDTFKALTDKIFGMVGMSNPYAEFTAGLSDSLGKNLVDAQTGLATKLSDNGFTGSKFEENLRAKIASGSMQAGGAAAEGEPGGGLSQKQEKSVSSSRSALSSLLGDVVGSKDEKLVSINEAQLSALQSLVGAVVGKGAETFTGKSLNTLKSSAAATGGILGAI